MERSQPLVSAPDGSDDFGWLGGPSEGLGIIIDFGKQAVNGGLKLNDPSRSPEDSRDCDAMGIH